MQDRAGPSTSFLLIWHTLAAGLAAALPYLRFHVAFWHLTPDQFIPLMTLMGAFVACAAISVVSCAISRPFGLMGLLTVIAAIFGLVFLTFLVRGGDSSRQVMLMVFASASVLIPLAQYLDRLRMPGLAVLALLSAAALALNARPVSFDNRGDAPRSVESLIQTGFYNVRMISYLDYIPKPAVRGGGIAKIADRFLLATGDGFLYLFDWDGKSGALHTQPLPYRVPANGDEFSMDTTGRPWHTPLGTDTASTAGEDAGSTVIAWWFRVTGILVQELDDRVRVFSSHYFWNRAGKCWVERVSMMEGKRADFMRGADGFAWKTVFETKPCLPVSGPGARRGTPFCGHFGGGRMVLLDNNTLLLAVGDFGFNGVASSRLISQDMGASYGKTVRINLITGDSDIYTSGNRNPEGLYRDPNGTIWDTEHGPRGGDELNIIKEHANYGWPIVTLGTDYGAFIWPLNPKQGEHEGFETPFYAWLPSIGVSDLISVEKNLFPVWHGDLLVSSLVGKTIYRLRIRDNRVTYSEPIPIDKRIRDISEGIDGRIALWADDDNAIISLTPAFGSTGEILFATNCGGCHKLGDGTSHRIGPDLWGVIGRKAASADGYRDYSAALRAKGGVWDETRINAFVTNPQAAVPGTAMEYPGLADAGERAKIIDYIKHAQRVDSH